MSHDIAFLHTSEVHVPTFQKLVDEVDTSIKVHHMVDATLLDDAVASGITDELCQRVSDAMNTAAQSGAKVVVCTCSTIGGIAENTLSSSSSTKSMRIDRAMADFAVESSNRILVLAAVDSTLAPTRDLLNESSAKADKSPEITLQLVPGAWPLFEAGRVDDYYDCISEVIHQENAGYDCVVLAQASMAHVAKRFDGTGVKVLASPEPGVKSAIDCL